VEAAFATPERLARYRAGARARAADFSAGKMAAATVDHYAAVLAAQPSWQRAPLAIGNGH
jgi:hypothetical protein